ncbi:MAG: hypothetical protein ACTSVZ_01255, partial [Promethearchaeota archaeon]
NFINGTNLLMEGFGMVRDRRRNQGPVSPVAYTADNVGDAGLRLANSECNLIKNQGAEGPMRAINIGLGLILYWTMKHWINIPTSPMPRPFFR